MFLTEVDSLKAFDDRELVAIAAVATEALHNISDSWIENIVHVV
jgi:hypothetical protein